MKLAIVIAAILVVAAALVFISTETMPPAMPESESIYSDITTGIVFDRETTLYPARIEVVENDSRVIGFSGDTDRLDFGIVPQGGLSTKFISITNNRDTKVQAKVFVLGLNMVRPSPESVMVEPGMNATVEMVANVADGVAQGNHTGSVMVLVVIPRHPFISQLW